MIKTGIQQKYMRASKYLYLYKSKICMNLNFVYNFYFLQLSATLCKKLR